MTARPAKYLALRAIAEEGAGGAELARRAGVSGPAVSQLVAALDAAGLIERSPAAADRRRQTLALWAAGARVLRSAERLLRTQLSSLVSDVPPTKPTRSRGAWTPSTGRSGASAAAASAPGATRARPSTYFTSRPEALSAGQRPPNCRVFT